MSTTGASPTLNVAWKGSLSGTVGSTAFAGKATFTATTVNGGTATGSFSGGATVSVSAPSNLAALCGAKRGIKKLALTGTITFGSSASTSASWPQNGYGPDRNGFQPNETTIGISNVHELGEVRTYQTSPQNPLPLGNPPLIAANGTLFDDIAHQLFAFDASGKKGCSTAPTPVCTPMWSAPPTSQAGAAGLTTDAVDGLVFVTDSSGGVFAYDATAGSSCKGTPYVDEVCLPIWSDTKFASSPSNAPVVANGVLYVPGGANSEPLALGNAVVAAFDAVGSKGCNITSTGDVCAPMWTTTTGPDGGIGDNGSPTVSNGVLYIEIAGQLLAFDANGCSPVPTMGCPPMWAGTNNHFTKPGVAPAVVNNGTNNGTVYVPVNTILYAFGTNGSNCPVTAGLKTCTPLWKEATGEEITASPAVANGTVFVTSSNLYAFDATTGTPQWTSTSSIGSGSTSTALAIAHGVIYVRSNVGLAMGFDAAGCSGAKTCMPLGSANPDGYPGTPIVANGVVYFSSDRVGTISAYSLSG
jgi:outer membrane protein assembly factor BamB